MEVIKGQYYIGSMPYTAYIPTNEAVQRAKANDGSEEHFQLSSRIVIDLTKEKPVIRNNGNSTVYRPDAEVLLQINGDLEDAIKKTEADLTGQGTIFDLSGRQVSRPAKGIYIKDGKKVVLK